MTADLRLQRMALLVFGRRAPERQGCPMLCPEAATRPILPRYLPGRNRALVGRWGQHWCRVLSSSETRSHAPFPSCQLSLRALGLSFLKIL